MQKEVGSASRFRRLSAGLSRSTAQCDRLTLQAKGLLMVLLSTDAADMDSIMSCSKDGRDKHRSTMQQLERGGYVVRRRIQDAGGRFVGWFYLVDEKPIDTAAIPRIYREADLEGAQA